MPTTTFVGGEVPAEARQGRQKQRYGVNGERLVAGCIPVRFVREGGKAEDVEVLLISSRRGKGFCFPKGGWEDDESVECAAMRETVEEAGVRGTLEEPMLGTYPFSSGKSSPDVVTRHQGKCLAHMFVMHVAEELEIWPEREERNRFWCPLSDASTNCRYEWMRLALASWVQLKGWVHLLEKQPQQQSVQAALTSVSSDISDLSDSLDNGNRLLRSPGSRGPTHGAPAPLCN